MKDKMNKNLVKVLKRPNQLEIFLWLVNHHTIPFSALDTWNILFRERGSENPDACIKMYDELNMEEKIELEHVFSTFVYKTIQVNPKRSFLPSNLSFFKKDGFY